VYGLRKDDLERLTKYVRIPAEGKPFKPSEKKWEYEKRETGQKRVEPIDINEADTAALISLPGIGSKLAGRIVNFREKLGGFYSIEQVREVYGLSDSNFQKFQSYLRIETSGIRKIRINEIDILQLKAHPYFKQALAGAIIAYRNEHGPFSTAQDLKRVMSVTDEIFLKILPYIDVGK
jgi:competence ComEA-like helix-hairpin-helix protein